MPLIPDSVGDLVLILACGLLGPAAVKSQWRLMKMGMSEKARKRWVLICALSRKDCQFWRMQTRN